MSDNSKNHEDMIRDAFDEVKPAKEKTANLPDRIGAYKVVRCVGVGGMGIVYLASQEKPKRGVALKVMRGQAVSEKGRMRFEVEGELLGRLQHEGIAQVFESGMAEVDGEDQPYIAMEFIEDGSSIDDYVSKARLGRNEIIRLLIRVCDAVHHAHQKGVVHRDLKPANVLVGPRGIPKVLDFGLARAMDLDVQLTSQEGSSRSAIGTFAYMSPEQIHGEYDSVDARSDIYSLGVLSYRLLAGIHPYGKKLESLATTLGAALAEDIAPLGRVAASCRGDVETIVQKAMAVDPERRYSSADAMAEDWRRLLDGDPIAAKKPSLGYVLTKLAHRHRGLVAGVFIGACALIVGLVLSVRWANIAEEEADRAESESTRANEEKNTAERMGKIAMTVAKGTGLLNLTEQLDNAWPRRLASVDGLNSLIVNAKGVIAARPIIEGYIEEIQGTLSSGKVDDADEWRSMIGRLKTMIEQSDQMSEPGGLLTQAELRLETCLEIHDETVTHVSEEWVKVLDDLEGDRAFEGVNLKVVEGLVPSRKNPFGLWEFYLHESGDDPEWDERTGSMMAEDTALCFVLVPPLANAGVLATFVSKFEMTGAQADRLRLDIGEEPGGGPDPLKPAFAVSYEWAMKSLPCWGLELPTQNQWYRAAWGHHLKADFATGGPKEDLQLIANIADESLRLHIQERFKVGLNIRARLAESWNDGFPLLAPVGSFAPNDFGFFDIHGNVAEICNSRTEEFDVLMAKGGSYDTDAEDSKITFQRSIRVGLSSDNLGIRPVINITH